MPISTLIPLYPKPNIQFAARIREEELSALVQLLQQAENDFIASKILLDAQNPRVSSAIYFHSQQVVEKLFKVALSIYGELAHQQLHTHDLVKLNRFMPHNTPHWHTPPELIAQLERLNAGAVQRRYIDNTSTQEAKDAFDTMAYFRKELLRFITQKRPKLLQEAAQTQADDTSQTREKPRSSRRPKHRKTY